MEKAPLCKPDFDPALKLLKKDGGYYLEIKVNPVWRTEQTRGLVTSEVLGNAIVPGVRFENHDGSSLKIDTDYFGKSRNKGNPSPAHSRISDRQSQFQSVVMTSKIGFLSTPSKLLSNIPTGI